jgi:hypothetical protein
MRCNSRVLRHLLTALALMGLLCVAPAWDARSQAACPEGEECEPNNRFGDASPIVVPGEVLGRITPAGDADWYVFSVTSAGELSLKVTQVAADLDIWLRVWNSNRDTLSDWFRPPAKGSDTAGMFDLPVAGRYYLELAAGDGSAAADQPYLLQVGFTPAVDPLEPNDTFGAAAPIQAGRDYQATLFPLRDTDWYRLVVDHRGELQVSITAVPPEMEVVFRLWNGNRETLSDWFAPLARGGDTLGSFDLADPGEYFIEVTDANQDARATTPYTLRFTFTPTADDDEPNDQFRDATPLRFDTPHIATILPLRDTDWYRLQVDRPGELQLAVTGVPANLDIDFRIWNANREVLSDWFAPLARGGDTLGSLDLAAPGRYYIETADGSYDARSVQPFTVTATFKPAADPFEPNDSFGAATPLELGSPVQINILPRGDVDWHYVELPNQGQLNVAVTEVPANLAVAVRVWNANRETISDWFRPLARGGYTEGFIDVPTAGRYYLEVADAEGRERSVEPFTLTVTFEPTADRREPNDSLETATRIELDQAVYANILPVRDRDWYAVNIPRPATLYVLVTGVSADLDINCRLWDSQPTLVRDWFGPLAKGGNTEAAIELAQPGRYYLEIADGYDDARSIQPYLLYLSLSPIDMANIAAGPDGTPPDRVSP